MIFSNEKTWNSLPRNDRFGRLYKESSYGSLDGNMSSSDPEVISVTLESQDIIGLGFNICGNYGDGIQVSEVNNRGPAKESGQIKVGDRILSVTVSYEHIVYEDALTILSYASPYPVKILVQKATDDSLKTFDGKNMRHESRRLSHPLYRSRSMDTIKSPPQREPTSRSSHPKRTQSDLKSGHKFLKWSGKNSRKSQESLVKLEPVSRHSADTTQAEVVHAESNAPVGRAGAGVRLSSIADSHSSEENYAPVTEADIISKFVENNLTHQKVVPDKPERKRRKSDISYIPQDSGIAEVFTSSQQEYLHSQGVGSQEIEEELIVPDRIEREEDGDLSEQDQTDDQARSIQDALHVLTKTSFRDYFNDYIHNVRSPSPEADPVEEEIIVPGLKSDPSLLSSAPPPHDEAGETNSNKMAEEKGAKLLNEQILERIIAMNSFPPGTQGLAGVMAGGSQGGVVDDFIPDNPSFIPQPVPKPVLDKQLGVKQSESNVPSSSAPSASVTKNRNLAYEIRDDLITGIPFAIEINKHKQRSDLSDYLSRTHSSDSIKNFDDQKTALHTSSSFDNGRIIQVSGASPAWQNGTDGFKEDDTLDWSGQRLVRSESFSNIFVND
ncbi:uncharacterized protein LOC131957410 isoform X2 [Physella acuta]|nr:uncharacterized protein LOC131957410 isoform X2 [Physella acuta]